MIYLKIVFIIKILGSNINIIILNIDMLCLNIGTHDQDIFIINVGIIS